MSQTTLSPADWLWLAASLCRLHRIPFDPELYQSQCPLPQDVEQLQSHCQRLGLKARWEKLSAKTLTQIAMPFVAFEKETAPLASRCGKKSDSPQPHTLDPANGRGGAEAPGRTDPPVIDCGSVDDSAHAALVTTVLIVRSDGERVLFFPAGSNQSQSLSVTDFLSRFRSDILIVEPAEPEAVADSAAEATILKPKAFGFHWFIPELLKHKPLWRDVLLAAFTIQVLGLGLPIFTQIVIDKVIVHQTFSTLAVVGSGMGIFMLFSTLMTWIRQNLIIHTGNKIDAVLGDKVFAHLVRLPHLYFQHRPTGTLIARLQGIETIRDFLTGAAVTLLLDLPFMVLFLAVMFVYSWQLSLIALGLLVLLAGLSLIVTPLFRARLDKQFLHGARNQAFLTEHVAGMETVKALQMEPGLQARYRNLLGNYLTANRDTKKLANTYNVWANGLEQMQTLGILIVGALLVMRNDGFTIGMLVAFQMFAGRLSQPVLRLVGLYQEFQQANLAVKRLGDFMNCPPEPVSFIPRRQTEFQGRIDIQGLSFRYAESEPWLFRNLTLLIPPGKTVALMGASGCGKSSLAKLLLGFLQPQEGCIKLDGLDTQHLAANELRQYFGVVPQETVLFSGTLYDNLLAAAPQAGFEDIVIACRMAGIHDHIQSLSEGYQTPVGEKGAGLSGGQKQRIAIARALLKRPKILIFDEATASLDPATAAAIANTINTLKGQATVLFIAHYLPQGLQVDGVVKLDMSAGPMRKMTESNLNGVEVKNV